MSDYMNSPEEVQKHPDAFSTCQEWSQGDPNVMAVMWSFWNFEHALDDLLDESGWESERKELALKATHDFVANLLLNPFVRANAAEFRAILTQTIARSMDGDALEQSPVPELRKLAPAVRCGDIDALLHMAYLHGGWAALRKFGPQRDYDVRLEPEPIIEERNP